jgi:hypothetical protein
VDSENAEAESGSCCAMVEGFSVQRFPCSYHIFEVKLLSPSFGMQLKRPQSGPVGRSARDLIRRIPVSLSSRRIFMFDQSGQGKHNETIPANALSVDSLHDCRIMLHKRGPRSTEEIRAEGHSRIDATWSPIASGQAWFRIRDEDMSRIAEFRNLEVLSLADTGITGAGLVKLKSLNRLNALNLARTSIKDEDIKSFLDMPNLRIAYL